MTIKKNEKNSISDDILYEKIIQGPQTINEYEELVKIFLKKGEYKVSILQIPQQDLYYHAETSNKICKSKKQDFDKNKIKREIYFELSALTGYKPPWGIMTGIRPIKLVNELIKKEGDETFKVLLNDYLVSEEKAKLSLEIANFQEKKVNPPNENAVAIYIGIPFCPTRCHYCSFASNSPNKKYIDDYLLALEKEIKYVSKNLKKKGQHIESVYIGGGTPTTLSEDQLEHLLDIIDENFHTKTDNRILEFTVEAGRVDTITESKLLILKENKVNRISINPQTIHQSTLDKIGRNGTFENIKKIYKMANDMKCFEINMDIIAGLDDENLKSFQQTVSEIIKLKPDNITIHSLAVKKASNLIKINKNANYERGDLVVQMLSMGENLLKKNKYNPYYLYRQKHMSGNLENIGYGLNEKICLYNIRIMADNQSIIALGAGAISKFFFKKENRLERVANVIDLKLYIEKIDEMIKRKEEIWR